MIDAMPNVLLHSVPLLRSHARLISEPPTEAAFSFLPHSTSPACSAARNSRAGFSPFALSGRRARVLTAQAQRFGVSRMGSFIG